MKHYFSRITEDHWTPKNRLEKAAKEIAHEMECRIIPGDKIKNFMKKFKENIDALNNDNPRCKPLVLDIWINPVRKQDVLIYINGVFYMELILAKE